MASSLASASAASAVAKAPCTLIRRHIKHKSSHCAVSFRLSPKPKLRIFTKGLQPARKHSTGLQAQLNESSVSLKVPVDVSSTAAKTSPKSDVSASDAKDAKSCGGQSSAILATEESTSEFITQVSSLVKLVDSRDIVELQLKQLDCEVIIRKKEALPQPQPPASAPMMYAPPPSVAQSAPLVPAAVSAPAASPVSSPSSPPAAKSAKSSLPPLKCPMAGTFYQSSAPGEPPFVKVGDKVQKGQVLCIIEAMKLMNEIEADQSGTIVDILAEDGKPVSVDTPLFVIQP